MSEIHEGGCQCGSVRYRTTGQPHRTAVCHCRYCQTRTGSAFGVSAYFNGEQVEVRSGELNRYRFTTESGRSFETQFCPTCGTTLFWTLGLWDGVIGVAAGTFDPPSFWFDVTREVFTRSKAPFVTLALAESHETTASYAPVAGDSPRLRGQ
ncbi:GFA family protein [Maritimibacter sp. DP1N21-5]|uniref:GFA family protein n=1 Tax=Maritimibacter sp. DP1N21-5 TaxID=2836867 RepID=UPI001C44E3B2|nr:GFA family protein [Maritimibacter sp. DP1N21-5]MBV7410660.1 GFA family protein [Maritimibacter sp. DP1N21-5]